MVPGAEGLSLGCFGCFPGAMAQLDLTGNAERSIIAVLAAHAEEFHSLIALSSHLLSYHI